VDAYIAGFPPATRKVLRAVRSLIRKSAPKATEKISYGIPAFQLKGANLVYFAGWTHHVGLYPLTGAVGKAFEEELRPYKKGKATAQFPLREPLPSDLIRRVVRFRVKELEAQAKPNSDAKKKAGTKKADAKKPGTKKADAKKKPGAKTKAAARKKAEAKK